MSKLVRKVRPDDYWRIGEHENWFSDMAKEGLHLKKMGLRFAHFIKGEPKDTRYRIDISQGDIITSEQRKFYAENGWDYVTDYGDFNVYSSPTELNAPELHTDPAEQSYTLKVINDKMFGVMMVMIMYPLIFLFMVYFTMVTTGGNLALALLDNLSLQWICISIINLNNAFNSINSYVSMRSLRKSLLEGKPIDHSAPWKNRNKINKIISSVLFIISIMVLIIPIMYFRSRVTQTLPITNINLPLVRLAEIEQNPQLIREKPSRIKEVDYSNYYNYEWNLFAPVTYETHEEGIVANEVWKDKNEIYNPRIVTKVYKLRIQRMKEGVLAGLIEKSSKRRDSREFIEIPHPDFEKLIVHEGDAFKEVFAYKGKGVIYVKYFGYAELDSIIESMAEKIVLISD